MTDDDQSMRTLSVDAAQYVLTVRGEDAGVGTLNARLTLANALIGAGMESEAVEVLTAAVIDASRFCGPANQQTLQARLLLGKAHLANREPLMALCVFLALLEDASSGVDSGLRFREAVRCAGRRSVNAIEEAGDAVPANIQDLLESEAT